LLTILTGCAKNDLQAATAPEIVTTATVVRADVATLTPPARPTSTWYHAPSPTLNPTSVAILEIERRGEERRVAHETIIALTPSVPRPTYPPYESPGPVDLPLGVIEHLDLGMHVCECDFENSWLDKLQNGDYIQV